LTRLPPSLAVEHLRTLLSLILTNRETRKLLSDVCLIGRDLFARSPAEVIDTARPDPDALARVDEAGPSNKWKGPRGQASRMEQSPKQSSDEQRECESQAPDQTRERFKDAQGTAIAETRQPNLMREIRARTRAPEIGLRALRIRPLRGIAIVQMTDLEKVSKF
jgi:Family of unknown function (DUF5923)